MLTVKLTNTKMYWLNSKQWYNVVWLLITMEPDGCVRDLVHRNHTFCLTSSINRPAGDRFEEVKVCL